MTNALIRDNLIAQLDKFSPDIQLRGLDFVSALIPKGIAGKSLLKFEGAIPVEDLKLMSAAIEEGCEKVDIGE